MLALLVTRSILERQALKRLETTPSAAVQPDDVQRNAKPAPESKTNDPAWRNFLADAMKVDPAKAQLVATEGGYLVQTFTENKWVELRLKDELQDQALRVTYRTGRQNSEFQMVLRNSEDSATYYSVKGYRKGWFGTGRAQDRTIQLFDIPRGKEWEKLGQLRTVEFGVRGDVISFVEDGLVREVEDTRVTRGHLLLRVRDGTVLHSVQWSGR
jgi:hypothetical protein